MPVSALTRQRDVDDDTVVQRLIGELRLRRFQRSRSARERDALFERYLPLARSLAARYRHTSEPFDDLLQVASIGLLKAIERYDPARGNSFSSFAVPTILGELRRHLRDHTWSVHVPRDLQELGQRLPATSDELALQLARQPTIAELAAHLDVTDEQVLDARQAIDAHSPASLDEPLNTDAHATTLADLLADDDAQLDAAENAVMLERYLAKLPARSRAVLLLRFRDDLKQREIGTIIGVSQMHVSRLIRQALQALQALVAEENDTLAGAPERHAAAHRRDR